MQTDTLESVLIRLATDMIAVGSRWAIIGGLAVSAHVEPRTTRDVDIVAAAPDNDSAQRLIGMLQGRGYQVHQSLEHVEADRLSTVRLLPPGACPRSVLVDLLFASSGIESEIVSSAIEIEILPGLTVPVACLGHLIALKILAAKPERPRDSQDARDLLQESTAEDVDLARRSLELISRRGFDRDKDLLSELEKLLAVLGAG